MTGVVETFKFATEAIKFYTRWSLKSLLSYYLWPFPCLIIKYLKTKKQTKTAAKQEIKIKKNCQEEIKTVATPQRIHEVLEWTDYLRPLLQTCLVWANYRSIFGADELEREVSRVFQTVCIVSLGNLPCRK